MRTPPRKISLHREKGSAFLSLVLVMALVSGMLSLGSAKMSQAAMNANGSHSIAMQAGAYASGKAEILKKEDYSDLKNQGKTPIANSNGFYDEVSVGVESVYDAEKNIKQKECQIHVYYKDDALPRSTIKLIRYSAESTSSSVPQGSIIPWYGSIGNIPIVVLLQLQAVSRLPRWPWRRLRRSLMKTVRRIMRCITLLNYKKV